jgi:hypothetical protein
MALRPKLNRIWASSNANLRRDPGDAKYIQGWISEIPTYQVLNYLQYKIDTTLLAIAERGIAEWGSDVTYGLGSVVWDELDKKIYISSVGAPDKDKAPSTNSAHWVASSIQISRASYDSITAAINAHIADITGNPHQLTAGRLNAYNKDETDAIFAQYRALVLTHASDKNNPHGVTAAQAGAVPITGGTYTGDVTFIQGVKFTEDGTSQLSAGNGLFLRQGNALLGITAAGVAVAGDTTSTSPIVTEEKFQDLKKANEPDYAVPREIWRQNLIGDFGVQVGRLNVDFPFPDFDAQYGCWNFLNPGADASGSSFNDAGAVASLIPLGTTPVTVCVDVLSKSNRNPSDTLPAFTIGMTSGRITLTGASRIFAESGNGDTYKGASYQLTGPINTWYRIVARLTNTEIALFVNGVKVVTAAVTSIETGGSVIAVCNGKSVALTRLWLVRNFRIWAEALTDKQISTL